MYIKIKNKKLKLIPNRLIVNYLSHKFTGKFNGCLKGICLENIFRNFLWRKKKTTFFNNFLIFPIKNVSKLFKNSSLTNALKTSINRPNFISYLSF